MTSSDSPNSPARPSTEAKPPVAIVTGAGGGLGRAIALRLANDGFAVAAVDVDQAEAEETTQVISNSGPPDSSTPDSNAADWGARGSAASYCVDLRDASAITELVEQVTREQGPIGALVNNAAIFPAGSMLNVTPAEYDDTIAVNQRAYFLMAQAVARSMIAAERSGAIVNLGSITQHGGWADMVPYATTKGAAATMTRAMATELGPSGIRVNCVAPGAFPTRAEEMHADPEAYSQRIIDSQAIKRRGAFAELAAAVSFLIGSDSSFVTGQTLNVDGGWKMN